MATNNNNISITSFNKGMNTDVSYSNIQEGQYLYGENIRVSSYNGDKKQMQLIHMVRFVRQKDLKYR